MYNELSTIYSKITQYDPNHMPKSGDIRNCAEDMTDIDGARMPHSVALSTNHYSLI